VFRESAESMNDLFVSQFSQRDGFIVYQRSSFLLPVGQKGNGYIVSAAERDRFIADFTARSPAIMGRMIRDIFIAFFSFAGTSQVFHALLGEYASNVELALLLAHLVTIVMVENRRMKEIWDAPMAVLATRAPAPEFMQKGTRWLKPMSAVRERDLFVGASIGVFCAATWILKYGEPRAADVSAFDFYAAQAMFALMSAVGVMCVVELVRRTFSGTDTLR
jgi:hypothetical protein